MQFERQEKPIAEIFFSSGKNRTFSLNKVPG
jgi:uncharacterized protein YkuJ